MNIISRLVFIVLIIGVVSGCATMGKYMPKHALNPAEGVSIPHPVEVERNEVKAVTVFTAIMDPGLFVEVLLSANNIGKDEGKKKNDEKASGVWPAIALDPITGEKKTGAAYLWDINYWGDFLLRFEFEHSIDVNDRILYFNHDAGWIYTLTGREIEYNPRKFDKNKDYQKEVFIRYGLTLKDLDRSWVTYLLGKGLDIPHDFSGVKIIEVGTPEWDNYKVKLMEEMPERYTMGDGEIRLGKMPKKQFCKTAVELPGSNIGQRFVKNLQVPIAFFSADIGVLAGASVIGDGIAAGVNDDWDGLYARAKAYRKVLAPNFRYICRKYKELLMERDRIILKLMRR